MGRCVKADRIGQIDVVKGRDQAARKVWPAVMILMEVVMMCLYQVRNAELRKLFFRIAELFLLR